MWATIMYMALQLSCRAMYIILAQLNEYFLKFEQNLIYQNMYFEWMNVCKMGR